MTKCISCKEAKKTFLFHSKNAYSPEEHRYCVECLNRKILPTRD